LDFLTSKVVSVVDSEGEGLRKILGCPDVQSLGRLGFKKRKRVSLGIGWQIQLNVSPETQHGSGYVPMNPSRSDA
jgi:hypothetical protein